MGGGTRKGKSGRNDSGKENKWIDLKPLKDLAYFSLLEICAFFTCPFRSKDSRECLWHRNRFLWLLFVNVPMVMHLETYLQMAKCGTASINFSNDDDVCAPTPCQCPISTARL